MIRSSYPYSKATEVGQAYLKTRKESGLKAATAKRVVPVAARATTEGFEVYAIYDVKPGKVEEALLILTKSMLAYGDIEGYKYQIDTLLSGSEAMPLIGMEMPE